MSKRRFVFYTNWDGQNLKCACLFHNPLCNGYKSCEELELTLNPYDDIETVMKDQRRYVRDKGAMKQR